jgi:hypothetical protein
MYGSGQFIKLNPGMEKKNYLDCYGDKKRELFAKFM